LLHTHTDNVRKTCREQYEESKGRGRRPLPNPLRKDW